jgi:hypothetical protein
MQNDPELNGKYLGTITQDFIKVADLLFEASYQIRVRKISDYPIFPISKISIPIGEILIDKELKKLAWNYYISFLAEFESQGLVKEILDFQNIYKNPDEFCCLFVIDDAFNNFVFVPYPDDINES